MADEMIYESSAGGGYGDGTTSGQTGMSPLNAETMDDREFPTDAARQEAAAEDYQPHPTMPQMMTNHASPDGPFHNLTAEPHGQATMATPHQNGATLIPNSELGISQEKQQEIVQAAMNGSSDGTDDPSQEV